MRGDLFLQIRNSIFNFCNDFGHYSIEVISYIFIHESNNFVAFGFQKFCSRAIIFDLRFVRMRVAIDLD